jgi:glycosyltransferase involved in cell wall biosynthesis
MQKEYKENLNWNGWITPFSGYGIVMMELAVAMNKLTNGKVSIGWQRANPNNSLEWKTLTSEQKYLVSEKPFEKARLGIIKTTPDRFGENQSAVKIGYTMVENTMVNPKWIENCNGMAAIFVPSKFLVDVFKQSGCTRDIYVVKQGVNSALYPYIERPKKNKFIFGTVGWMDERKNWKELIRAFCSEFEPEKEEPVELWIKNSNNTFGFEISIDHRVKIIDDLWTFEQMMDFYRNLDCFVFPSRAEGSGMPPREAMATGLPVIMTNWSGLSEICDERYNYPIKPVAIDWPDYRKEIQPGFQARIDIQELMYLMRYVYEHRKEAMEKGKLASEWMHKDWNWEVCGQHILNILTEHFDYK